jgi:hypothetical protein
MTSHMTQHMENVNRDINKEDSIVLGGVGEKEKKEEKPKKQLKEIVIPSKEEFLKFCFDNITQWGYDYKSQEFFLTAKYEAWISNNWKDGHNKEIKNWKSKIKVVVSYREQKPLKPNSERLTNMRSLD